MGKGFGDGWNSEADIARGADGPNSGCHDDPAGEWPQRCVRNPLFQPCRDHMCCFCEEVACHAECHSCDDRAEQADDTDGRDKRNPVHRVMDAPRE